MSSLSDGLIKGILNMGLDKLVAGQLKKYQESDSCPQVIKQLNANEIVGDAFQFVKFGKGEEKQRKDFGDKFVKKYFAIFEPVITQNLLIQEMKAGAKYELVLSIENDDVFFDAVEKLKSNPRYESDILPHLQKVVDTNKTDIETEIFNMVRNALQDQGKPVSVKCQIVKRNMTTKKELSSVDRSVSEVREYFQKQ